MAIKYSLIAIVALGSIEAIAWWWMHPAATGPTGPVLTYQPGFADRGPKLTDHSPSSPTDHRSPITDHSPSITPLPEIYRHAAPILRCSSGQVLHIDLHGSAGIHVAFFEWDGTDTGSVLEAFRHMPEACMGSIGLKLVSKEKPIHYTVRARDQEAEDRRQEAEDRRQETEDRRQKSEVRGQKSGNATAQSTSSTDHRSPITDHSPPSSTDHRSPITDHSPPSSTDHRSPITDHSPPSSNDHRSPITDHPISNLQLIFDHTVFRDPTATSGGPLQPAPLVHAFRAVWVSGVTTADARDGLDGRPFDDLRAIRLDAARTRFRPAHARVIQGAVRGIPNPDLAWQAFEHHVLHDLTFHP